MLINITPQLEKKECAATGYTDDTFVDRLGNKLNTHNEPNEKKLNTSFPLFNHHCVHESFNSTKLKGGKTW